MRLSQAGIQTLLLVGNHDLPPASGRANALQEFDTLEVPHVKVLAKPAFLSPVDLEGLPLQIIALPWISRSGMLATLAANGETAVNVLEELENRITRVVEQWVEKAAPSIPLVLTAHGMVQGAELGSERTISLGSDLTFPGSLVKDPRIAYSALGHIHKYQDLNKGSQPPVIYPGSIERVDFGEVQDEKGFVIATIEPGKPTVVERRILSGRRFIDRYIKLDTAEDIPVKIEHAMPAEKEITDSIFRLTMEYPRSLEPMIDEPGIRQAAETALEFHLVRKVRMEARSRVGDGVGIGSLPPDEQLDIYWRASKVNADDRQSLNELARSIIASADGMADVQTP